MVRPATDSSGFTLVEIMIATGILVAGILSLFSIIATSQRLTLTSSERTQAKAALHAEVARLRALLRNAPLSAEQFSALIEQDSTVAGSRSVTLVDPNQPGEVTVNTFRIGPGEVDEQAANAALARLSIDAIDLDADGVLDETSVLAEELSVLAVTVTVSWRPSDWEPGDPLSSESLGAILY